MLRKIFYATVGLALASLIGVGTALADGTLSFPAYSRIQDGATTATAVVTTNGNLAGPNELQVIPCAAACASIAAYGAADGEPGGANVQLMGGYNFGFNGTTWDRLRVDPGASGVLRTTTGGVTTATIAAATAGPSVIKNSAGRIARVLVTTAGTASETFFDNASACSGTIIGITPPTTTVGQVIDFSMPATNGVTGCGGAGSPAVTVSFN